MHPLLLFFIVALPVFAGPLVWLLWSNRLKPGATNLVMIGAAAGEAEMNMWLAALRSAGISSRVVNVGDAHGSYPTPPYAYEVWVREKDADRARSVLGF
jgi:hypothetical protein